MSLRCGIVGLPNVGKSTLFNALTSSESANAANYPFCTIEPNVGIVEVFDPRLYKLALIAGSQKTIPSIIEFVDIAGLVQGASQGQGLGNKFLSHIREVDAIIHLLRCFDNDQITHVHGKVDPNYDAEIIEAELILADIDSISKRIPNLEKKAKTGDKESIEQLAILKDVFTILDNGQPARVKYNELNDKEVKKLNLLTTKPILYVCNVSENDVVKGNDITQKVVIKAKSENTDCIIISAQIEAEIALIDNEEDRQTFLNSINLEQSGLNRIVTAAYKLLDLKSYFTIGPKEARSWTFKSGTSAPAAAGIIHTDFERGFICAEVVACNDYINLGGEVKAKEQGKVRLEGKNYIMQDGDVVHFRFNV